jgi:cobalt-zinc-cadmium efflux system outer membrane protein
MSTSVKQSRAASAEGQFGRYRVIVSLVLLTGGCSVLPVDPSPPLNETPNTKHQTPNTNSEVQPAIHLVPQLKEKHEDKTSESAQELPAPRRLERPGLTLDQAINATLIADPKIRAGLEAINQASADALTVALLPNPTLLADIQLLPLTRPFTVTRQGGPPQTDYQLSMPIDWFLFGKRAAQMASARLGMRQSEADYADLVRQRVRDTAVAFYDVLEARALLELARKDRQNLTQLEARIRRAVDKDVGGRAPLDLERVSLDVLRSQQTEREAASALVGAKARLRALLGRSDADPDFDVSGRLDAALTVEPPSAEEAFLLAVQNRPDIQSLRWQVAKAEADINVETRKAYPQVTPAVGYTRQFQQKAIGFPDADSYLLSLTTSLPFFDRNQGNRAKARSVLTQNTFNLQTGVVDLRAEIEQAVQELRTAYRNAGAVAEQQLKLAQRVLDRINQAANFGGRPINEILDAQRAFRETYRLYITNRANYWRALYRLNAAVGRQWK